MLVLRYPYSTSNAASTHVLVTADLTVTQDESGMRLDRFLRLRLSQEDEFPVVNNIMVNKWLRKRQVKLLVHSEVSTTDRSENRVESRIDNVTGANAGEYRVKTIASATTRTETGQIWRVRTVVEKGQSHQSDQDSKAMARYGSVADTKDSVDTSFPTSHSTGQSRALRGLLPLGDWILYMDDRIVVLNKPAGIAVQDGTNIGISVDSSLQVLQDAQGQKPRLVHRLDKTTSGILILARTRKAAQELTKRFHDGTVHSKQDDTLARTIEKKYIAIAGSNEPLLNTAADYLARIQVDMAVLTKGKQERIHVLHQNSEHEPGTTLRSITDYRILDQRHHGETHWSLLELYPRTGRKHQLRVHCAQVLKGVVRTFVHTQILAICLYYSLAPILGDLKSSKGGKSKRETPGRGMSEGEQRRAKAGSSRPVRYCTPIRLKRLEKLQSLINTQQAQEGEKPVASTSTPTPTSNSSSNPVIAATPSSRSATPSKTINITKAPSTPKPASPSTPKQPALTFEAWQNEALSRILLVSLNENAAAPMLFLSNLAQELTGENEPLVISQASLDRVLVERMSIDPNEESNAHLLERGQLRYSLFDYLLDCWKRLETVKIQTGRSKTLPANVIEERVQTLNMSKSLLVSYAGLVLQMPDMFPQMQSATPLGAQQLVERLFADQDTASGIPTEFLNDLATRFKDDGLENIIQPLISGISARARTATILTDWRAPIRALMMLVDIPTIAAVIPQVATWNPPNATARQLEIVTALGPFFKTSGFCQDDPSVAELFGTGLKRNKSGASGAFASIRGAVRGIHTSLFQATNGIIRSSPEAREKMLSYFYSVLGKNERRAQMQVDRATVSGDGYIYNITEVLMQFCDPFLDSNHSKIDKISQTFFRGKAKIDISKETRICAPKEVVDAYAGSDSPASINFISDIFFLTLGFHHIGVSRMYVDYKRFMKDFYEMRDQYERLKEQEAGGQLSAENGMLIKRYEIQLEKMLTFRLSLESQILDPIILGHSFQFYNLVMAWLLRLVDPAQSYPRKPIQLPLPTRPSDDFAILPEYIIEDIVEYFLFVLRYSPETVGSSTLDELITFTMVFLITPGYIKNPHLKAKLVEILFFMSLPYRGQRNDDTLGIKLNTHPMALKCLIPAIMNFYVEVENTGRHSQFYDKFNIRYNISQILKFVWPNPIHRDMVKSESKRSESFVRFANLLMNDTTYLLDEGLTKLVEINGIEVEMSDKAAWAAQTPQYRQEREGVLRTAQRQASSYIALGNETVNMLSYLTMEIKQPFLTAEIVDRLATMLNYNLVILVGEKMSNLKVRNPDEYRFQPRILLSDIIAIYLHLDCDTFIAALARDERSYSAGIFHKASRILEGRNLKSPDEIAKLKRLVQKVEDVRQQGVEDEEELGEIPDEFLDPLLYTLMEDPVLLPTSNISIDRSTIKSHLLSDTTDPFNRMPLKIGDVIENVELRDKIQAWKASQRSKKRQQPAAEAMELDG
ncbi:hypothetical protein BGZ51_000426 [Haplosporangium sp. Z 767]|nr:hypothetical protein BGZ51_000426 [Haplosporangium sp. Z 767]